jgi:ABC-type multidrug transport system permease subunit
MLHVSRDIDSRIYESYLYGPVDEAAYIISICISYSLVNFLAIICFPLIWILLIALLSGITPSVAVFIELFFGYCLSNLILLIALCIGALAKKSKIAIWYLLLFHVLCIGIVLGNTVVSKYLIPLKRSDVDVFSFFRNISQLLFDVSVYFSPYTQLYLLQKNFYYAPLMGAAIWGAILIAQVIFAVLSRYLFKRSIK